MPHKRPANLAFDPSLCPLLQGLDPDEQQLRMENDPMIKACILSMTAGGTYPARCGKPQVDDGTPTTPRPRAATPGPLTVRA